MVKRGRYSSVAALVATLLIAQCSGFVPNARSVSPRKVSARNTVNDVSVKDGEVPVDALMNNSNLVTPEGTGLSSPISRIAKLSRGEGFYRAKGSDRVVDVMQAITSNANEDVALVYDDESNKLLGMFTETDYIRVCIDL